LNVDIKHIGERSMTRTSDTFGALALTILTVFALWSSTLAMPLADAAAAVPPAAAAVPPAAAAADA
jgi:hypothetical protein